jgi:hypothetical protein
MLIFVEGGKPENPEKNPQSNERINNKLNSHMTPSPGIDIGLFNKLRRISHFLYVIKLDRRLKT